MRNPVTAFRTWLREPEAIGPPDCPLFYRWTLIGEPTWPVRGKNRYRRGEARERGWPWPRSWPLKIMVHGFQGNADDRDVHDHPRGFLTLVLRGGYDDLRACPPCTGTGRNVLGAGTCVYCGGSGAVLNERMRAGMIRYRSATHAHRTRVHPEGCWTIVIMGPFRRKWGFWREGRWFWWRDYEALFGFGMRCEPPRAEDGP